MPCFNVDNCSLISLIRLKTFVSMIVSDFRVYFDRLGGYFVPQRIPVPEQFKKCYFLRWFPARGLHWCFVRHEMICRIKSDLNLRRQYI